MNRQIKAIIPARSGSKRVPGKNIRMLGDRPLILWTIQSVVESGVASEIFLSTDSEKYFELAKEAFPNAPLTLDFREATDAGDGVKIFDYVSSNTHRFVSTNDDVMLLTLPTVPFRGPESIRACVELFSKKNLPVFSCCQYDFHTSFAFSIDDTGGWKPVFEESPMLTGNTQSQAQKKTYHPNGAIYVRSFQDFNNKKLKTFYDGALPFEMSSFESIDIDTEDDFQIARKLCTGD